MKYYVVYNEDLVVTALSDCSINQTDQKQKIIKTNMPTNKIVGKRLPKEFIDISDFVHKDPKDLKVAVVCNWNDQCGISTYSKYLIDGIKPKVADLKIFSEEVANLTYEDEPFVERCWKRGEPLLSLANKIHQWGADYIIIQHEFGIFPNAFHFMRFIEEISNIPHVITMHSVYQHLDKVIYTECMKNIIVHSDAGKQCLKNNGNTANVFVIPHGCIEQEDTSELWNICVSPYTVVQFGFGFRYKGVEEAIKAIAHLIHTDEKFKELYYIYLCSESENNKALHNAYYKELKNLCKELGVEKNVCILRKYQTDAMLNLYLRLMKIALFPYVTDEDNVVFGASGAIRIAMANERPVIASNSHMFDDLEGVVPRPSNYIEMAQTIDNIFSNEEYRNKIIESCRNYVKENNWSNIADQYLSIYNKLIEI